jgi:hypothetical protein
MMEQHPNLTRRARHWWLEARERGVERWWDWKLDALARAESWLGRAPQRVPVLSRVAGYAGEAAGRRRAQLSRAPLENYDSLNVRSVRERLGRLDRTSLLQLRSYEMAHKNRKTVLQDIEREWARRFLPWMGGRPVVESAPGTPGGGEASSMESTS